MATKYNNNNGNINNDNDNTLDFLNEINQQFQAKERVKYTKLNDVPKNTNS